MTVRIALVGDRNEAVVAHRAIPETLAPARTALGVALAWDWVPTARLGAEKIRAAALAGTHGVWCVPASPYESMEGALAAIRLACEERKPFLGTCSGFQHALIEYLRNVQGWAAADHAESSPEAELGVIVPLACALTGAKGEITFLPDSLLARAYGSLRAGEEYNCSYAFNSASEALLAGSDLRFTAFDPEGEPRGFELSSHPFHVGTLFQPERSASSGRPHPLIMAFVAAAAANTPANVRETPSVG
ncbi:MAG: hypothetical protein M0002_05875 [Rhodospirillales bacterium]|nr:hypothetical protein [Rhodospirillales bacterium]